MLATYLSVNCFIGATILNLVFKIRSPDNAYESILKAKLDKD